MKSRNKLYFLLSVLSGILLYSGWTNAPLGFFTLIAFVPLLYIEEEMILHKEKKLKFFLYSYLAFFIWNLLSTWWIYYATLPGAIAAVVFNSLFYTFVFWVYHLTRVKLGRRIGDLAFIVYWLAFEYIYLNGQISWVWLILGNAFSYLPKIVQWYEYTGTLGGSLWVLIINLIVFRILMCFIYKDCENKRLVVFRYFIFVILLLAPILFSLFRYYNYKEKGPVAEFIVTQPNIDPYSEKFTGRLTPIEQVQRIINVAKPLITDSTEYVIAPETAIPVGIWESQLKENNLISPFYDLLKAYPNLNILTGATTYLNYGTEKRTPTARPIYTMEDTLWYDAFNSALNINNRGIDVYHKSKLVIGVEMMPYPEVFSFLGSLFIDLGGTSGSLGTQKERTVFTSIDRKVRAAPIICYESIYGEFVTGYVKNGANVLTVITNDGWWDDSPGYKQHFSYSVLRAIETRRSVARSANTGISGFINQRGDVIDKTKWWVYTAKRNKLHLNDEETFYVRNGDYIGRASLFVSVLMLIFYFLQFLLLKAKFKQ
jgi:apolipoprotein N-acyltransferase